MCCGQHETGRDLRCGARVLASEEDRCTLEEWRGSDGPSLDLLLDRADRVRSCRVLDGRGARSKSGEQRKRGGIGAFEFRQMILHGILPSQSPSTCTSTKRTPTLLSASVSWVNLS